MDSVSLKVFFASRHGLDAYHDDQFGMVVKWDRLRLDFEHEFLPGATERSIGAGVDCNELDARLEEFDPDLVVTYGYRERLQRRAAAWAARNGKYNAMIADSELRSRRTWLRRAIKYIWLKRHLRTIDVFLTVGDANESYYRHYGVVDERFVRSSFPIDRALFDVKLNNREQLRSGLRASFGIPDNHVVVLMAGKMVPWKRQYDLVQFSNSIQSVRGNVTIILAGMGPEEAKLKSGALKVGPGGVIFAGFVSPNDLVDYYAASDLYAHCSEVEPHSLAISEAIYAGLPVVLSDRCGSYGPTDDVRHGLNGFVYRCGSLAELSAALVKMIDDRLLRLRMADESTKIGRVNQALAHGKALAQAIEILRYRH